jgi:hypothetical protein
MIYCGTDKVELIYFHLDEDKNERHFITMEQDADENVFYVKTCCNPEWEWKFAYTAGNYEMVKHAIFDAGFDSENMENMLYELDEIFEEYFEEIVMLDECNCDCENGCNHCGCK